MTYSDSAYNSGIYWFLLWETVLATEKNHFTFEITFSYILDCINNEASWGLTWCCKHWDCVLKINYDLAIYRERAPPVVISKESPCNAGKCACDLCHCVPEKKEPCKQNFLTYSGNWRNHCHLSGCTDPHSDQ